MRFDILLGLLSVSRLDFEKMIGLILVALVAIRFAASSFIELPSGKLSARVPSDRPSRKPPDRPPHPRRFLWPMVLFGAFHELIVESSTASTSIFDDRNQFEPTIALDNLQVFVASEREATNKVFDGTTLGVARNEAFKVFSGPTLGVAQQHEAFKVFSGPTLGVAQQHEAFKASADPGDIASQLVTGNKSADPGNFASQLVTGPSADPGNFVSQLVTGPSADPGNFASQLVTGHTNGSASGVYPRIKSDFSRSASGVYRAHPVGVTHNASPLDPASQNAALPACEGENARQFDLSRASLPTNPNDSATGVHSTTPIGLASGEQPADCFISFGLASGELPTNQDDASNELIVTSAFRLAFGEEPATQEHASNELIDTQSPTYELIVESNAIDGSMSSPSAAMPVSEGDFAESLNFGQVQTQFVSTFNDLPSVQQVPPDDLRRGSQVYNEQPLIGAALPSSQASYPSCPTLTADSTRLETRANISSSLATSEMEPKALTVLLPRVPLQACEGESYIPVPRAYTCASVDAMPVNKCQRLQTKDARRRADTWSADVAAEPTMPLVHCCVAAGAQPTKPLTHCGIAERMPSSARKQAIDELSPRPTPRLIVECPLGQTTSCAPRAQFCDNTSPWLEPSTFPVALVFELILIRFEPVTTRPDFVESVQLPAGLNMREPSIIEHQHIIFGACNFSFNQNAVNLPFNIISFGSTHRWLGIDATSCASSSPPRRYRLASALLQSSQLLSRRRAETLPIHQDRFDRLHRRRLRSVDERPAICTTTSSVAAHQLPRERTIATAVDAHIYASTSPILPDAITDCNQLQPASTATTSAAHPLPREVHDASSAPASQRQLHRELWSHHSATSTASAVAPDDLHDRQCSQSDRQQPSCPVATTTEPAGSNLALLPSSPSTSAPSATPAAICDAQRQRPCPHGHKAVYFGHKQSLRRGIHGHSKYPYTAHSKISRPSCISLLTLVLLLAIACFLHPASYLIYYDEDLADLANSLFTKISRFRGSVTILKQHNFVFVNLKIS